MKLAQISSFLLSKEQAASLKLQDQALLILIPKPILDKIGVFSSELSFDLVEENQKVSLLGRFHPSKVTPTPILTEDSK